MRIEVVQIDPNILGGTPCFAGTRVPTRSLFDHIKLGYSIDGFLEQFPTVKRAQVEALLHRAENSGGSCDDRLYGMVDNKPLDIG